MSEKYKEKLSKILDKTCPRLSTTHNLEFKNCFGAVTGYVNGQIFASCGKFGTALKLPKKTLEKLLKENGVKPLKYFKNGHIKKEYAVLSKEMLNDQIRLKQLIGISIKFAAIQLGACRTCLSGISYKRTRQQRNKG